MKRTKRWSNPYQWVCNPESARMDDEILCNLYFSFTGAIKHRYFWGSRGIAGDSLFSGDSDLWDEVERSRKIW